MECFAMMNLRMTAAVMIAAGAAFGFQASAQVDDAAAKVLTESAGAINKITGISYRSQLYGVGALKEMMDGEGQVRQIRTAGKVGKNAPLAIDGQVKELGKGKTPFKVASNGEVLEWINDSANTHLKRPLSDRSNAEGQAFLSLGSQLLMTEFTEAEPYSKQLKAQKVELKPNEQVRGVDCQVVMVSWENGLRSEIWWIGAQDHLPRKIEMAHGQNRDLAKGVEIWEVKPVDGLAVADLGLKTPAGYKEDFVTAPPPVQNPVKPAQQPQPNTPQVIPPPPAPGLVPGSAAPEFTLQSDKGETVTMGGLKGKVVILTFGGSRFPKTDAVNAVVGQVAESNKGKNVVAYTLACREEDEKAAVEHANKAGVKFPVLLGADTVRNEYRVVGFPFTYVITADGRVSKAFQGSVSAEQLGEAVQAAVRGEIAPAPAPAPKPVPVTTPPTTVPQGKTPDLSPTNKK
jgi:peroxiredoxin